MAIKFPTIIKKRTIKYCEAIGEYKYWSDKDQDFVPTKLKHWLIVHIGCGFVRKLPNINSNIIYCPKCNKYFESHHFRKIQIQIK